MRKLADILHCATRSEDTSPGPEALFIAAYFPRFTDAPLGAEW